MPRHRQLALLSALIALAISATAVAATLSTHEWKLSSLVRMSAAEPLADLARETDPDFFFVDPGAHYDGVYFYAMARDPLARGEAHELIDRAAYRYGHVGFGWLAWLASGGGRAEAVPAALAVLALAGVFAAAFTGSLVAHELGWTGWGGLVVAFSPGVMFAVTADTSEPVALTAVGLGILAYLRRRWLLAGIGLAAACLIKEPLLLVPAGLLIWEFVEWRRGSRSERRGPRLAAIFAGPMLAACWYVYLRITFGTWPMQQEAQDFLTVPLAGWVDAMRRAAAQSVDSFYVSQVGSASVALLAVVAGGLVFGFARALQMRTPLDPIFCLTALLVLSLNWLGVLYPKDLVRESTLALALLPAAIGGYRSSRREPLVDPAPG